MANVTLTTSGTGFMATAGTMFPAIPIRYFIPVYDYRIDPYVLPTSGLTPISAAETTSAVDVFGEKIYNIDTISTSAYTITNNEFLIYDSNQTGTSTISNNRFDGTSVITLLNGRPLSHVISATSIVYSYPNWTTNGYTLVSGNNDVPTGYSSTRDRFFRVTSFAPITSAAGGQASGLFKIMLDNLKGNFKFNKIALYAARILSGGVEDTGLEPVLVGIAYFNRPVIKSNDGSNLNFIEADIEIQFSAQNYFGNVQYLSNNNWNYVGGEQLVWFDGKVAIGTSAIPGSWLGRAKFQITESNSSTSLLRLTNDNSTSYVDIFLDNSSNSVIEKFKGSRPELLWSIETSGSTDNSKISLNAYTPTATRTIDLRYLGTVSGDHHTGFDSIYGGYLDTLHVFVNGQYLSTYRSDDVGSFGNLTLGIGSDSLYYHPGKFLTVHGGTLLVGSNLVSGTLSASSNIFTNHLFANNDVVASNDVVANGNIRAGLASSTAYMATPNLAVATSAHFAGSSTFSSTISGAANMFIYNLFANNDVVASNDVVANGNIRAGLASSTAYMATPNLAVATSAHFAGPVTFSDAISSNGDITSTSITTQSLNTLYAFATNLTAYSTLDVVGFSNLYGSIQTHGNLNVSGLAALGSNLYMDVGDIHVRRKGYGINANITTVAAGNGGSPSTAIFSNGEAFGIVTGWSTTNDLLISTTKANSSSIILYSIRITSTAPAQGTYATHCITSISNGSSFTLRYGIAGATATVNWMIISPSA